MFLAPPHIHFEVFLSNLWFGDYNMLPMDATDKFYECEICRNEDMHARTHTHTHTPIANM